MADLMNTSQTLYMILNQGTADITGSWFLMLLLLVVAIIILGLLFRIPFEFIIIFAFPVIVVLAAFDANFRTLMAISLFVFAYMFLRMYIFR